jgi:hypothetical protein
MSKTILEYVSKLADHLSPEEKVTLVERITESMGQAQQEALKPASLRGAWRKYFLDDFDIDKALDEVRHEWEKEWPEVFNK